MEGGGKGGHDAEITLDGGEVFMQDQLFGSIYVWNWRGCLSTAEIM